MRKFFLIPVLALFTCVNMWGATHMAGTFAELQDAIEAAAAGDVIQLTADFTATSTLTIGKSISIDGQSHKITGAVKDNGIFKLQGTSDNQLLVAIENVEIDNAPTSGTNIILYLNGYIDSLAINNCKLMCTNNSGNPKPIEYRGTQLQAAKIGIHNSHLYGNTSGYAYRAYNPAILHIDNSQIEGYGCLNFQYPRNAEESGARGTQVYAKNCNFDSPNVHSGGWNSFMAFNFADDGISMELDNCGMNAEVLGNQGQAIFGTNGWNLISRRTEDINIVIKGDNSYINGTLMDPGFIVDYNGDYDDVWENGFWSTYPSDAWFEAHPEANDFTYFYHEDYNLETGYDPSANFTSQNTADINLTITGGTYSVNPNEYKFKMHVATEDPTTHMPLTWTQKGITIPDTHEVKEITTQQGDQTTTLYRVRKKITTAYSINDDAESHGEGQNENTEFLISANETVNVPSNSVIANYVEVSNDATLTVPDGTQLEVTNGLDVTDGAQLVVEAGSTVIIGEGGVTSENTNSIVITANENGSASFLLDPEVIVNTTPNITVKMTAKGVGYESFGGDDYYYWFRFAAPVAGIVSVDKVPNRGTYFYKWNYAANEWSSISALSDLTPFQGYTLTTNHEGLEDVTYTFEGQLAGNQDMMLNFQSRGFNYFGNSYTGYMDVHALVEQLMNHEYIDGTIYLWDNIAQGFYPVTLGDLAASDPAEVAPMQTFILRQINSGEPTSTELNYASAIWGNPRYGNTPAAPVPARRAMPNNSSRMNIIVTAANGQADRITLKEGESFTNEFDKGYDAVKFMNERTINLYSTIDGENYGIVASDDLEGTMLSFQTNSELAYTLSFANVRGNEYAIRDNVTGAVVAIEEGATYEFAAQPNSTVEGRFEIMPIAKVPTAIENADAVKANVKGIYTIMGQYLGEDFDVLPAGIYVVNGVKIVK